MSESESESESWDYVSRSKLCNCLSFLGSEDAVAFAYELKLLLECLGVIDCKVSGQVFRVDANVSLHREGEPLGVRTEIKNMNSLKDARKGNRYSYDT